MVKRNFALPTFSIALPVVAGLFAAMWWINFETPPSPEIFGEQQEQQIQYPLEYKQPGPELKRLSIPLEEEWTASEEADIGVSRRGDGQLHIEDPSQGPAQDPQSAQTGDTRLDPEADKPDQSGHSEIDLNQSNDDR